MNDEEKKLSEQAKRLEKIRRVLAENSNNVFAMKAGISPQLASNIIAGRKGVGRRLAEKILAGFPEVSREWLYTGEGQMLATGNVGDNNTGNVATTGGTVTTIDKDVMQMLKDNQRERLELLSIIRNLTEPKQ